VTAAAVPSRPAPVAVLATLDALCTGGGCGLVGAVACSSDGGTRVQRRQASAAVAATALARARLVHPHLPPGGGLDHADDGRPLWPPGVVGSVSHGAGLTAAVVAPADRAAAVGLDLERASALDPDDAAVVLTARERALVRAAADPAALATVLWSAKEAAFKAWSGSAGGALAALDPQLVEVDLDLASGRFAAVVDPAHARRGPALRRVEGELAAPAGAVLTLAVLHR